MSTKDVAAFVALALLAAVAFVLAADQADAVGGALTAGFAFPIRALTKQGVQRISNPDGAVPGSQEAIPWVFFDTQTYTSAATVALTFFQTVNPDRTLSNMESAGQFPEPQAFRPYNIGLDVLQPVTSGATGAAGAWQNVQSLVMTGRGTWTLEIAQKQYAENFPLSFLHTSGGVQGFGYNEAAAGTVKSEYAINSIPDGGWNTSGSIVIPSKQNFRYTLRWPAALTLFGGTAVLLRVWMAGVLYRRIL